MTNEQASAGEVPEWARDRAREEYRNTHRILSEGPAYDSCDVWLDTFARYIAAHEPEPVDPLHAALDAAGNECGFHISEDFVEACKARGVTAPAAQPLPATR